MLSRLFLVTFIGAASLVSSVASAGEARDPAAAETLFRKGRELMEAADCARATPLFAESLRLDFAAGTLMNLAACEEQLGRLASAWQHFTELIERLPPDDDRRAFAVARIAKLAPRVPRLTVTLAATWGADAKVTRDEIELGPASLGVGLPVDPGEHTIVVTAPGLETRRSTVRLAPGEQRVVDVGPGAPSPEGSRQTKRTVGWIVGATSVASIATGTFFGVRALQKRSESDALCAHGACRDPRGVDAYNEAKTDSRIADITIGVGLVALAVATYLVISSPSREPAPAPRAAIRITPAGIGASW